MSESPNVFPRPGVMPEHCGEVSDGDASQPPYYQAAHDEAVGQGREHYIDPRTGYLVFTELSHKKRGTCCQSACRHCPYGFKR